VKLEGDYQAYEEAASLIGVLSLVSLARIQAFITANPSWPNIAMPGRGNAVGGAR
jgi:hypothetical protein